MTRTWDIFCSVVDNFGDIGVCWRLARQLSSELRLSVRLWVDDLAGFHRLCREVDPARISQLLGGVEIKRWDKSFAPIEPAEIAIEGFGVHLPDSYIEAMVERQPHPVWINLEYLSAERWVEGCHGLPSPHPTLPLVKYFFFPGFTSATGGLLMESGLSAARNAFQDDPAAIATFWRSLNLERLDHKALRVSLFCYDNAPLPALVKAWSSASLPVACIVPEGRVLAQLSRIAGRSIAVGTSITQGRLVIAAVPFLELDQYDRLLWACDLNFVRGEDSFVRAQLAARPLVWQAYPQEGGAHLLKISAFLERYTDALEPVAGVPLRAFYEAWNQESADIGGRWDALRMQLEILATHARHWAADLARGGNLAVKLAEFCENRLK